jgi:hypothetical protein
MKVFFRLGLESWNNFLLQKTLIRVIGRKGGREKRDQNIKENKTELSGWKREWNKNIKKVIFLFLSANCNEHMGPVKILVSR